MTATGQSAAIEAGKLMGGASIAGLPTPGSVQSGCNRGR
jgi:hypothetical protein